MSFKIRINDNSKYKKGAKIILKDMYFFKNWWYSIFIILGDDDFLVRALEIFNE